MDMNKWPRITIVTPSYNQGRFIKETIESVRLQNYPNLEHVVIDGGSKDDTLQILCEYNHLKVISEPDSGQGNAINKGFGIATGDIYGFLNSDDTLLPEALTRVAEEIDPSRGRHIVMGRCRFIDEKSRFIGIEHPCQFVDHARVLKIWKGHTIPQPAVFWTSKVWKNFGSMDESMTSSWIDYDLFCRFSKHYKIHYIDQVFANYRLHTQSKTESMNEDDRLEECIQISRRYWGKPWCLLYWEMTFSLLFYRLNRVGRGTQLLRNARDLWNKRQFLRSFACAIPGGIIAPEVVFTKMVYPNCKKYVGKRARSVIERIMAVNRTYPQTSVYLNRTDPWEDGWVGPRLIICRDSLAPSSHIILKGDTDLTQMTKPLVLTVRLDGEQVCKKIVSESGKFELTVKAKNPTVSCSCNIEVEASTWFVPHRLSKNGDYRPLSWHLSKIEIS